MSKGTILVIGYSGFSGIRKSIVAALEAGGCRVIDEEHTLRRLRFRPLYLLLIALNALLLYGRAFRRYAGHTPAANWARGRASQAIFDSHAGVDAVLSMPKISPNFHGRKRAGVRYGILTDHVNLLSKRMPDFGFEIPERGVADAWNRLERRVLGQQDCNFVLGSFVKAAMVDDYGIAPERVAVVGGGPNLDVDAERDGIVKDYSQKNILFVGLDARRKGLPVLERAFARVVGRFPDAKLHVAGVEGRSADGVTYHGIVKGEPLRELFYAAQVFALPAFREPFGIVFLEAMWAKAVCIGTPLGAMPEIIRDGESGYLVPPGNAEMLADRLIELFSDSAKLATMAESGYRRARQRFGWDKAATVIADRLLGGAPAAGLEPELEAT